MWNFDAIFVNGEGNEMAEVQKCVEKYNYYKPILCEVPKRADNLIL